MSYSSQEIEGQLNMVIKLRKDVYNRIQILRSFLVAYKKQIDFADNQKMMKNTIRNLQNSGFPKYESHVKKSIYQLELLDERLGRMEDTLKEMLDNQDIT